MNEELALGKQKIKFDRDATSALYRDVIKVAGADQCGCLYCKNFAAQRNKVYPEEFLGLLKRLGIDHLKEWESFEYNTENLKSLYGGWFLFCGQLIEDAEKKRNDAPFSYWFTNSFPNAKLPPNAMACAIEFVAEVPWILPEIP